MFGAIKALLAGISVVVTAAVTQPGLLTDGLSGTSTLCVEAVASSESACPKGMSRASCEVLASDVVSASSGTCSSNDVVATCAYGDGVTTYKAFFYAAEGGTCDTAETTCDALGGVAECW